MKVAIQPFMQYSSPPPASVVAHYAFSPTNAAFCSFDWIFYRAFNEPGRKLFSHTCSFNSKI